MLLQAGTQGDDLASIYFCNQRIYWPRLASGEKPQWEKVKNSWPLRLVCFRPNISTQQDDKNFQAWLTATTSARKLEFVRREAYPISFWIGDEFVCVDEVQVYEFVPYRR